MGKSGDFPISALASSLPAAACQHFSAMHKAQALCMALSANKELIAEC
jgi:hypothetical protein